MPSDYYDGDLQQLQNRGRIDTTGGIGLGLGISPKKRKPKKPVPEDPTLAQKAVDRKRLGTLGEIPGPLGTPVDRRPAFKSLKDKEGGLLRSPY